MCRTHKDITVIFRLDSTALSCFILIALTYSLLWDYVPDRFAFPFQLSSFLSLVSISKLRSIGANRICLFFRLIRRLAFFFPSTRFHASSLNSCIHHWPLRGNMLWDPGWVAGTALYVVTLCSGHVTITRSVTSKW